MKKDKVDLKISLIAWKISNFLFFSFSKRGRKVSNLLRAVFEGPTSKLGRCPTYRDRHNVSMDTFRSRKNFWKCSTWEVLFYIEAYKIVCFLFLPLPNWKFLINVISNWKILAFSSNSSILVDRIPQVE